MKHTHGLNIPQTLDEHCDPRTMALLVYDMQVGIRSQMLAGQDIRKLRSDRWKTCDSSARPSSVTLIPFAIC
jgi:hypothetical protein